MELKHSGLVDVKHFCPLDNLFLVHVDGICSRPQSMGEDSEALVAPGHHQASARLDGRRSSILCFEDESRSIYNSGVPLGDRCRISQNERTNCCSISLLAPPSSARRAGSGTVSKAWRGRTGLMGSSVLMPPSLGFRVVFLVKVHPFVYLV